jgi:hypothetical protein
MFSDRTKLRISKFSSLIIEDDSFNFGYYKSNGTSNKNGFLNKLIPNLLEIRKIRREKIHNTLMDKYCRKDADVVYQVVNNVIDEIYFDDEELNVLEDEIWIRPSENSQNAFDEISNSELAITSKDLSSYLRGLLNEYVRFPVYKREQIFFCKELGLIDQAINKQNVAVITYKEKRLKCLIVDREYDCNFTQDNYLFVFDVEKKQTKVLLLKKIENIYLQKQKYKPTIDEVMIVEHYINDDLFVDDLSKEREEE